MKIGLDLKKKAKFIQSDDLQFFKHSNINSLSFNICIGSSPPIDLFVFKSLITFITSSAVTGRNGNLLIFLSFLLYIIYSRVVDILFDNIVNVIPMVNY